MARGDVVVFTGPETLQMERNLEVAAGFIDRKECGYGLVYRSSGGFVDEIEERWAELKNAPGTALLNIKGAKADCRTQPPHPPAYLYFCCVKKEYVERIGGFDEDYLQGIYAEDDDFAWRMNKSGVRCVFEHSIVGIYQDHSREDKLTASHSIRSTDEDRKMRAKNLFLFRKKQQEGQIVANKNHIWGDPKVIIKNRGL